MEIIRIFNRAGVTVDLHSWYWCQPSWIGRSIPHGTLTTGMLGDAVHKLKEYISEVS